MKKIISSFFLVLGFALFLYSCKKTQTTPIDPCAGLSITLNATSVNPSAAGQTDGSISVTASPSGTYTFSINDGVYQASNVFNNLGAGTYSIKAKNADGCLSASTSVTLTASGVDPCASVNIVITPTVTNANACATNAGSISISATGSNGFTYQNGNGSFQANNVFNNLTAGSYNITVKDANGCTKSQTVTVGTDQAGPKFTAVKNLISSSCNNCHTGNNPNGGYSVANVCNIVNTWDRIQARCVNQTPSAMPPSGLNNNQKQIINDWINAGHRYTD